MTRADDILYFKILTFSFVAAYLVRKLNNACKGMYCGLLGFVLVVAVCRWQFLYSATLILINLVIIRNCSRQRIHKVATVASFAHLAVFRSAHVFVPGLPKFYPHANAVQLFLVLRCIGLSFELHDDHQYCLPTDNQALLEYFYNFIGLFGGPYYRYSVHRDMLAQKNAREIPVPISRCVTSIVCYILLLYILTEWFDIEYVRSDAFYEVHGYIYRLLYMAPIFAILRMRVYIAWTFGEACSIMAALGAYPSETLPKTGQGPSDLQKYRKLQASGLICRPAHLNWNFETVRNVDAYGCEFAPTFRGGMRAWNRSVQYWLAAYFYRRAPKSYRTAWTMLVSAYWHGIYPGYYLSFLTIPLCLLAEDLLVGLHAGSKDQPIRANESGDAVTRDDRNCFDVLWWFFRMRGFEYLSMGFLLLSFSDTLRYWNSIYFIVHVLCAIFIIYGLIIKAVTDRQRSKVE